MKNEFPYKDEIATYLEEYARHFQLPIQLQTKVFKIKKEIYSNYIPLQKFYKRKSYYRNRWFSATVYSLSFSKSIITCFQIHSSQYKSPSQIPKEKVLVVGGGNSGMQIAVELAKLMKLHCLLVIL